jgi:activating signal cointegrator complex subunit 3
MLTIAHVIRNHTDAGVINRDLFKIVYVAPMKALAAEMTDNFSKRLKPLGISVRELTGDMSLTKAEMQGTQILVTTPEKWDVVTRKGAGDASLISLVKLLIIDEVHLLHGERGPVVEALVARTLRLVESSQSMIRIVGLSATLPNYIDVARFLRVNPMIGLFFFDSRFRPIPLTQQFIGVKSLKTLQALSDMNTICYEKCLEQLRNGKQVMVFVHARNATTRTAMTLRELAQQKGHTQLFCCDKSLEFANALKSIGKSKNRQLNDLFPHGFGFHHAGMLRQDRTLVEKLFADGLIKVLVCTATLAWGVNLPAHAVIIKGTEIYDSKHGSFVDLGILDVLQIFGRAGRPQFDKSGLGIILTTHDKLNHYLSLLTNQFPIESNFVQCLADNLNAEISLGTISNVQEAIEWLSYTYLYVRMKKNPQVYGLNYDDLEDDHNLEVHRRKLIHVAAMALDKAKMIRYNERTEDLNITDLGRTASHFYIKYDTVEVFNEMIRPVMNEGEILNMMANAHEFQQLKVRDEEMDELDELNRESCEVPVKGGSENLHGKVNILMQTYLSRGYVKSFSLVSDLSYINQNAVRIARGLFQIILRNNNAILAGRLLTMSKMFERQSWDWMTPLRQFVIIPFDVIEKIENRGFSIDTIREMDAKEISDMLRNHKYGEMVKRCANEFPMLTIDAHLQPITRTVLRIRALITADFKWNDRVHGKNSESFWIWIEDPENNYIYHSEYFQITKKQTIKREPQEIVMTIPLKDPLPPQYYIRAISDTWLGSSTCEALSFKHLILPEMHPPHTDLLPLQPLPITALKEPSFEALYSFTHFNPIQTQIFHCLYHTNNNCLLGAPTSSGKTIAAEIAIFRVFKENPKGKVVYIAPLKALVKERISDWRNRFADQLGKIVVELTGDVTPDANAIRNSHVIVTTPGN